MFFSAGSLFGVCLGKHDKNTEMQRPKSSACGNLTEGCSEKTKEDAHGTLHGFQTRTDAFHQDVRCSTFNIYKAELTESLRERQVPKTS